VREAQTFDVTPPSGAAALTLWARAEPDRRRRLAEIEARRDRTLGGMAAAALRLRQAAAMVRAAERSAVRRAAEITAAAERRYAADVEAWQLVRLYWLKRGRSV